MLGGGGGGEGGGGTDTGCGWLDYFYDHIVSSIKVIV